MKKRVLIMMNSMGIGGVEKAFLNLLYILNKDNFSITILFYKKEGELLNRIPKWVKVEEMKIPKLERSILEFGSKQLILKSLKRYQFVLTLKILLQYFKRKIKKMFLNYNDSFEELFNYLPAFDSQFDVALDFFGHSSITTYYISEKVNAHIKATWLHRSDFDEEIIKYKRYYDKYDKVFGVSKACVEKFIRLFPEYENKCETFHNILLKDDIKREAEKGKGFNDNSSEFKILTVGRLVFFKGYDLAIAVAARLKEEGFRFKWYIIGEGPDRRNLEGLIFKYNVEDCFILLGKSDNPYPFMKQCDIYVQTSRSEGYCITLAEARILNKSIVTTNFFGAKEQITNGETGLIVNVDEMEIYEAVKKLMMDNPLRRKFEENLSREKVIPGTETKQLSALFESNKQRMELLNNIKVSV